MAAHGTFLAVSWLELIGSKPFYVISISMLGLLVAVFILGYAWGRSVER